MRPVTRGRVLGDASRRVDRNRANFGRSHAVPVPRKRSFTNFGMGCGSHRDLAPMVLWLYEHRLFERDMI
jgi:hypothetical protein